MAGQASPSSRFFLYRLKTWEHLGTKPRRLCPRLRLCDSRMECVKTIVLPTFECPRIAEAGRNDSPN